MAETPCGSVHKSPTGVAGRAKPKNENLLPNSCLRVIDSGLQLQFPWHRPRGAHSGFSRLKLELPLLRIPALC